MNNKSLLKKAQKLGREDQKKIKGGDRFGNRRCCEWEDDKCTLWTCENCQCP